jgi:hypothetical protein
LPWQPPHTLASIARSMVNGMSDAQVEEAVTSKERAGADAAPPPARAAQKPDTPIWPEVRMAALSRYEGSIERALHRAGTALDKLQARRREAESLQSSSPQRAERVRAQRAGEVGALGSRRLNNESAERTQFPEPPTPAPVRPNGANGSTPPN